MNVAAKIIKKLLMMIPIVIMVSIILFLLLKALPPVICNAVIVGMVLTYAYGIDILWMNMLTVGLGQAVVCCVLGVLLVRILEKQPILFKKK